jgi:hypothetical protein
VTSLLRRHVTSGTKLGNEQRLGSDATRKYRQAGEGCSAGARQPKASAWLAASLMTKLSSSASAVHGGGKRLASSEQKVTGCAVEHHHRERNYFDNENDIDARRMGSIARLRRVCREYFHLTTRGGCWRITASDPHPFQSRCVVSYFALGGA